jgi:hypothetical protein
VCKVKYSGYLDFEKIGVMSAVGSGEIDVGIRSLEQNTSANKIVRMAQKYMIATSDRFSCFFILLIIILPKVLSNYPRKGVASVYIVLQICY